ncbi:DUF3105 domain-containing protein [Nocardioides insulae]|uniref:DUF3105 domain-containing protein n=1 Tax=Nocardioides insulae TaxID=394734 RepID=UPI0004000778|nr:DUF3105 domain-containing protein [Nocardioides insulae]
MAKKSTKSDRQAVIDDIRKKQKSAERRRGYTIVAVCSLVALLLVGYAWIDGGLPGSPKWFEKRQWDQKAIDEIGQPAAEVCKDITTHAADGNQQHVPQGQSVDYSTAPPAYGPHWNVAGVAPAPMGNKYYAPGERPELEALVHNLEHGYNIVWYDEDLAADDEKLAELEAITRKFPGTENFRNKIIVAPWTEADETGEKFPEDADIVLTHWSIGGTGGPGIEDPTKQVGVFQECSDVSGEAIADMMMKYPYTDSPEPNAM